jgi:hypothetical protein
MKIKYILLLFSIFSVSVLFAQNGGPGNGGNQIEERRAVFGGTFSYVETIVSNNNVDLYFGLNIGTIEVIVKNKKQQIVCRKLVDTSVNNIFQLDLRYLDSGMYDLIILNQKRFILKQEKLLVN